MSADKLFETADDFVNHLQLLHEQRTKIDSQKQKRPRLNHRERAMIFEKTAGRCHICGGRINRSEQWEVDHVFPYVLGGARSVDNYLPAHSICNNYRWFYSAEEIQWVLKLGVWLRTRIEEKNNLALELARKFVQHEMKRDARRKKSRS